MPAPDLETLYEVEKAVETGLATVLAAETGKPCFTTFSGEELQALPERIEIECQLGEATEQQYMPVINGQPRHAHNTWNATLAVRYITEPQARGAGAAQHSQMRGKIRAAMLVWRGLFTEEAFPYHVVGRPVDAGSSVSVDPNNDEDVSELTFNTPVNIRHDAWPGELE